MLVGCVMGEGGGRCLTSMEESVEEFAVGYLTSCPGGGGASKRSIWYGTEMGRGADVEGGSAVDEGWGVVMIGLGSRVMAGRSSGMCLLSPPSGGGDMMGVMVKEGASCGLFLSGEGEFLRRVDCIGGGVEGGDVVVVRSIVLGCGWSEGGGVDGCWVLVVRPVRVETMLGCVYIYIFVVPSSLSLPVVVLS